MAYGSVAFIFIPHAGVRRKTAGGPTQAVLHRGLQGEGEQLLQPGDDQVRLVASPADGNLSA